MKKKTKNYFIFSGIIIILYFLVVLVGHFNYISDEKAQDKLLEDINKELMIDSLIGEQKTILEDYYSEKTQKIIKGMSYGDASDILMMGEGSCPKKIFDAKPICIFNEQKEGFNITIKIKIDNDGNVVSLYPTEINLIDREMFSNLN
jgi:hypothetical protein